MRLNPAAAACLSLAAQASAKTNFTREVEKILSRPTFADATVGIEVRDLRSGKQVYTLDETVPLIPASNQKLLVSTVALSSLGANFIFDTTIFGTSDVGDDGVLDGDVWIVGSGDPSLTSDRLTDLAEELVAQTGLKKITGKVYGDGTVFDDKFVGEGWPADDEVFPDFAQVAGLNCDLNYVGLTISPASEVGGPATVKVNGLGSDEEPYVEIDSTVKTVAEDGAPSSSLNRLAGTNTVVLSGSIPLGHDPVVVSVTIHDPIAFAAYRFAHALGGAGVEVSGAPTKSGALPDGAAKLADSRSTPLSNVLKLFLKPSQNMYGEALLKTVGRAAEPDAPGSSAAGAKAALAFLEAEGVDATGVEVVDGSGLTRLNTLTARFLTDLLIRNRKEFSKKDWQIFFDALPIGGVDGTLAGRFGGTPVEGKVRGKTGSLTGVSALSGYLSAGDGKEYVFSILMNGHTSTTEARRAQDDIVLALYYNGRK
ncbi:uncharacterized protein DNG_01501 [Cephalotrichum gorgonifer]|uniref:D-alanyl-D-alanine carboxypeptidase/D-alanyl-D-alanine-endopeptidase n=1 Tax=Cephalotrichum gorgonifer TaxID=2041049 RepID=A0AAE8MT45_9PEZI|nr:uncharacterized protein DNG_01501 [Cephalotrichum gorgonifer]